jgi:hypothetical protein
MAARLVGVAVDQLDRDFAHPVAGRHGVGDVLGLAQQGGKPAS